MYRKEDYIAVFDSGVGGVSVLRELVRRMPHENFYYYGDSAHAPYGVHSTEEVRSLTDAAVAHMLSSHRCKALVVACNTATAAAISHLRVKYPDLVIIGIEPAVKLAMDRHPGQPIGVMATAVTLREEKLSALLHRLDADGLVQRIPAPGLVELVEAGKADSAEMDALLQRCLAPYCGKVSALVLGCTHYPLAKAAIARVMGECELLDGGDGTARETARRLAQRELRNDSGGQVIFDNSDPGRIPLAEQLLHGAL